MEDNKDLFPLESGAAEPVGALALNYDDEQLYGVDTWPGMPLVGPTNIDEVNARIDEAELEIDEDGGMEWDDFKSMLMNKHTTCLQSWIRSILFPIIIQPGVKIYIYV